MIDLVLNKGFVLAQAEAVVQHLETPSPAQALDVGKRQLDEITTALARAISVEAATPVPTAVERKTYMPSDVILGVLQTLLEERLREEHPDRLSPAPGFSDPGGPAATTVFTDAERLAIGGVKWAREIGAALVGRLLRGRHAFVEGKPPPDFDLAADARIVLVGDWGLGNQSAREIAKLIRGELVQATGRQAHVIHLGDVYYSGETWEATDRFLDPWPVKPGEATRWQSWALNGNHDMYSGGWGYFDTILGDDRFRLQRLPDGRGISYFRLCNRHWQFLGLDTAWDAHLLTHGGLDGFLNKPQADWVEACVRQSQGRRTVLLTHHQLLSTHHRVNGNLDTMLGPALRAGGFDAWLWGHEHLCEKFRRRPELRYASCDGHGAVPQPVASSNPEHGGWEYNKGHVDADGDEWRWSGYAVLDLHGKDIAVRYVDELGKSHHPASLPV